MPTYRLIDVDELDRMIEESKSYIKGSKNFPKINRERGKILAIEEIESTLDQNPSAEDIWNRSRDTDYSGTKSWKYSTLDDYLKTINKGK